MEILDRAGSARGRLLATALDGEHTRSLHGRNQRELWSAVGDAWWLAHEELWAHLAHLVTALRDRRPDESTVDGLRAALPEALPAPQAALGTRSPVLLALLEVWAVDAVPVAVTRQRAAAPLLARVTAVLEQGERERPGTGRVLVRPVPGGGLPWWCHLLALSAALAVLAYNNGWWP
ncbi:hypothetical protein JOF53_001589 [Crossiella equi]|uniref:Type IV / VI secretion system DotU domain-containing protein n=1 Tax=Crossiella equi TaxID=130796 RepID=A0ABS5A800_9PSEU|nr:hypothetical protein [Crossiella equi]MBP2472717.1 hypothetical protein [Crossiella equi]